MTQDSNTEEGQTTDESNDNELIKSLRDQIKEKDKQLKARPERESLEAEIRAELERKSAISEQLVALGHPKGLSDFLAGKLEEDAEVSRQTVAEALQSIGYQVEVDDAAEQSEGHEPSSQESDLARVGDLSSKVQAAASGGVDPSEALSKKLDAATSQADIERIMAEAGATGNVY